MSGNRDDGSNPRVPPQNLDAECAVLGSMLLDNECIGAVRSILRARDYCDPDHGTIHNAILAVADDGGVADAVTVADALSAGGELARVGGGGVLADILESVPSAANAVMYAQTVARLSRKRRALRAGERFVDACYDPASDSERVRKLGCAIGRAFEGNGHGAGDGRALLWRPASEIEPRELRWCWPGRLPLGGVTILVGVAGVGKSVLTCDATARLSAGMPWPDGLPTERGHVAFANIEDPADRVTIPRLVAAGADLGNVQIVEGVMARGGDGEAALDMFDLRKDTGLLEGLASPDLRAVILDPASAFLPKIDDSSNAAVRSGLARLASFAERLDVAVILVHHFRKGTEGTALAKVAGSLAFGALARSVWGLVRDPAHPDRRLLLPIKANWTAEAASGLAFTIMSDPETGAAVCAWEPEPVAVEINDILAAPTTQDPEVRDAARWLRSMLAEGAVPKTEIEAEAGGAGINAKLLPKAKAAAGAESRRVGFGPAGHWEWFLPEGH